MFVSCEGERCRCDFKVRGSVSQKKKHNLSALLSLHMTLRVTYFFFTDLP